MFAYCNNNPINQTDPSGAASLWYYIIVSSDYGFIHRAVQTHILAVYQGSYSKEISLGGFGRADIVDTDQGAVWEVKHASQNPKERALIATAQASGYIGGTNGNVKITTLGEAGAFKGFFYIQCLDCFYRVDYWTPQAGAVLYSVQEEPEYEGSAYIVFVPRDVKDRSSTGVFIAGLVAGVAISGSLPNEKTFSDTVYAY